MIYIYDIILLQLKYCYLFLRHFMCKVLMYCSVRKKGNEIFLFQRIIFFY